MGKRGDMMALERLIWSIATPRQIVCVGRVRMNNTWTAEATEETRVAMVVDKANLTEEFRNSLVPQASGDGETVNWYKNLPNLARGS